MGSHIHAFTFIRSAVKGHDIWGEGTEPECRPLTSLLQCLCMGRQKLCSTRPAHCTLDWGKAHLPEMRADCMMCRVIARGILCVDEVL